MMFKVLIVSTSNTHKGPMAEGLLKKKMPDELKDIVEITSTGIYASIDAPCTIEVHWATKEFGVDLKKHKARRITREMMEEADCILSMDKVNHEIMQRSVLLDEILLLRDFSSDKTLDDIPNPKNHNTEFYRNVMMMIDDCTNNFIHYLRDKLL
ncbi:hypothetical protein QUF72_13470 [Desulfobacterales bacterium HSG2]|nr:hypothetical protein [Desulfobacterales bacterium HSG2]